MTFEVEVWKKHDSRGGRITGVELAESTFDGAVHTYMDFSLDSEDYAGEVWNAPQSNFAFHGSYDSRFIPQNWTVG